MATVYRRDFAPPARPSTVAFNKPYDHYVRARKNFEWSHVRIFDENNGRSIPDARRPQVDDQSLDGVDDELDEGVELDMDLREERDSPTGADREIRPLMCLRQDEPDLPTPPVAGQVPHLELKGRLTPSPPPRRLPADRLVSFVDDGRTEERRIQLRSHWVQTPVKWRDAEHPLRFAHHDQHKQSLAHRTASQTQTRPFLTSAHPSDRNAPIGSGQTFNVKSSGNLQESAARRIKSSTGEGAIFTRVSAHKGKKYRDSMPSLIRQLSSRSSKQFPQTEYQREFHKQPMVDLEI